MDPAVGGELAVPRYGLEIPQRERNPSSSTRDSSAGKIISSEDKIYEIMRERERNPSSSNGGSSASKVCDIKILPVNPEEIKILMYDRKQPALVQIVANRKRFFAMQKGQRLGAADVADYKKFLAGLTNKLNEVQPGIERKTQLLKAKQRMAKRKADCDDAVRRQQAIIEEWTRERDLMEKEYAWLLALPAYKQTQAIVKEKFKVNSSGDYYDVEEFAAEQEDLFGGSFEDLCREMGKEMESEGSGRAASRS